MRITFLGTGTSMGVPVAGGFGKQDTGDPRDERFRCSAWVQTDKTSILIDIGPEFRLQTLRSGLQRIDLLLITHEHIDHIGGLDDLRPFNYVQKHSIPVYTTQSCKESIMHRFDYMFEPNKTPGSVNIDIHVPDDTMTFQDCKITPLTVYHGSLKVYGYRINDLTYITDANSIPEKAKEQIKGSKMLVLNALRWTPEHPTHFTIPEAVELVRELDVPQTYLIHMSSHVNHEETNNKLPDNIRLAYDQLYVDL
ncbi:MAG TPA: MBL fold metallo-hydrolase [Balneolales bacterium]|nr:MBL fold metallo-hydrolase [Balneolales bacterium]